MSSNSPISRFENFARYLIEGSFDRLLRQPGPLSELAGKIAAAAESSQRNSLTANRYSVRMHPDSLAELGRQSNDVSALMEGMLARYGEQNRMVFAGELQVELTADATLGRGQAKIVARRDDAKDEPTAVLSRVMPAVEAAQGEEAESKKGSTAPLEMTEAYLIINGRRHIALDKAVNSLGRSLENDVVLEDPGVSRSHAQIRWRNGQFEIFDLGSRAGMLINGRPVARGVLKSGDVITLGTAAVIYGEEDRAAQSAGQPRRTAVDITQELSADD